MTNKRTNNKLMNIIIYKIKSLSIVELLIFLELLGLICNTADLIVSIEFFCLLYLYIAIA